MTTKTVRWLWAHAPRGASHHGRHRRDDAPVGWRWAGPAMLVLVAIALLTGCGGVGDGESDNAAAPGLPSEASATIGSAGGTLDGPDGTQVVIPPQALTQDTVIRIARTAAGAPGDEPEGYQKQGAMYEFTPHDIVFERPVTLRMPVPAAAAASGASGSAEAFAASPTSPWHPVESTLADGMATWQSTSFSWLQLYPCAPRLNDPHPCIWTRLIALAETATSGALTLTSVDPSYSRTFRLTESATVHLTFRYQAARDCTDPRLTVTRFNKRNNVVTRLVVVDNLQVGLAGDPTLSSRSLGSHLLDVAFTDADNGTVSFGSKFSCQRTFQPSAPPVHRQSDIDGLVIVVAAAAPVTAPPVVTTQPADVTVAVGASAAFTVAATAPDSLTLDWQRSNDAGVSWTSLAFSGTRYSFAAAAVDNAARFRVRVCNVKGNLAPNCIFSGSATLTVTAVAAGPSPLVAVSMAAGFGNSLVAASDGTVWAWGYRVDPATGGYKEDSPYATRPVQVQGLSAVKAVAVSVDGGGASYALHVDGTVSAWGVNATGALGDRTTVTRTLPVKVLQAAATPMDEVCSIAAGGGFLLMARETGCSPGQRPVTFGPWIAGFLSGTTIGGASSSSSPLDGAVAKAVPGWPAGQTIKLMAAPDAANSAGAAFFLSGRGDRFVWGANGVNMLGAGVSTTFAGNASGPVAPDGLFWAGTGRVELGRDFALVLDEDGNLLSVGRNLEGQLGIGSTTSNTSLLRVATLPRVTDFSAGQTSAAAITGGQLWAWGWNGSAPVTTPTRVGTGTGFTAVVVGDIHSLAIGPGGELYSWGDSSFGGLGRSGVAATPTVVVRP